MKKIIEWLKKFFAIPKPDPVPQPVPLPEPPKEQTNLPVPRMHDGYVVPDGAIVGDGTDVPPHNHPADTGIRTYNLVGCKRVKARWNPTTSKGLGKVIWPAEWCGKTLDCYWWSSDSGVGDMSRAHPHEMWSKERYYTKIPIASVPTSIYIRCETTEGPIGIEIANTKQELN